MSIHIAPRPTRRVTEAKAGPVGPGAGVLNTEFPLERYNPTKSPQKKMQRAWALSFEVPWIAAAEDAITERFSSVDWALEDENDETIDDEYQDTDAQSARALIEKPQGNLTVGAPFYRSDLWSLTCRAMGICGSAFIFLDQLDAYASTPKAMLPIAPWRMFPAEDENGNLVGWSIDKTQTSAGIPVRMDEILHYRLRPGFVGHFGVGLVESALIKAQLSQGLDNHLSMVLSAGGRLSGILSPSSGVMETETMVQMERDWRTVVEQADAAKRLQLVRAPVKFDRTTLTPQELQIRDLMDGARDDLLGLWGVPLSIIGGTTPSGLNSGDTRKYDEAAIWQGPVHSRLNVFREVTQYQLLDRWTMLGTTIELELDEPEFDDDSPRYDLLGKSLNTPLTNEERRALIGLPPTGDPIIDLAILLPATIVPYASAPPEDGSQAPTSTEQTLGREDVATTDQTPAAAAAGETTDTPKVTAIQGTTTGKAVLPSKLHGRIAPLHASLVRYREHAMAKYTPLIRQTVGQLLRDQQHEIAAKMRKHADHIAKHPGDTSIWWDKSWDSKLRAVLAPRLEAVAQTVSAQVHDVLPPMNTGKAAPAMAVERVMLRGAARVTGINETTRDKVKDAIARGLDNGLSVTQVADLIEGSGSEEDAGVLGLDMGSLFDDYRAEMIARTELMDAYNASALGSYSDAGVEEVQAIDGDGDPECAERDGQTFTTDEADMIEDHPNGTLDWVPVVPDESSFEGKADDGKAPVVSQPQWSPIVNVNFGERSLVADVLVEAPVVDVHVPEQPTPNVIVAPTVVHNEVSPTPIVNNVAAPEVVVMPSSGERTVKKNRDGSYTVTES